MALGTLLYLLVERDTAGAERWLGWIETNAVCLIGSGEDCRLQSYRLCTDDSDGRCNITPNIWAVMGRVWQKLGLSLHPEMEKWMNFAEGRLVFETRTARVGYELHLKAVIAFLYQELGLDLAFETQLAEVLVNRQPDNLFFRWLNEGRSQNLGEALLQVCPLNAPAEQVQWAWERDTEEQAWLQSMGWDCAFIGTLLLKTETSL